MAAVVHAGDGLLADVAALREAHRALDDAGLAGQVLALMSTPWRGRPCSMRRTSAASVADRLGARGGQRFASARRPRAGVHQQVDARVGGGEH